MTNGRQFMSTIQRVAQGGTAVDAEVISRLLTRKDRDERVASLTTREREVLGWMAQDRSNAGIAEGLFVTGKAVAQHIGTIFTKLDLPPSDTDNRRAPAVLAYLDR